MIFPITYMQGHNGPIFIYFSFLTNFHVILVNHCGRLFYKAVIIWIRFDFKQERQGYFRHRYNVMYKIFASEL